MRGLVCPSIGPTPPRNETGAWVLAIRVIPVGASLFILVPDCEFEESLGTEALPGGGAGGFCCSWILECLEGSLLVCVTLCGFCRGLRLNFIDRFIVVHSQY